MFKRRAKLSLNHRLLGFLWPRSGWRRSGIYIFHRMARIPGSAHSIACGFAIGSAISFTPFLGLHFAMSAILAYFLRVSIIASAIGTFIGNPWTYPFIFVWIYNLGLWMGAVSNGRDMENFDFPAFFGDMVDASLRLDWPFLFDTVWPVFWPMLAGSIPTAAAAWAISYFPLKPLLIKYQRNRARRMMKAWENK